MAAALAGFVALVTLLVTKEQAVSEFRQAWINALRDDLGEAISAGSTLTTILQHETGMPSDGRLREWARISAALSRVELRLNREGHFHKELIGCIRAAEGLLGLLDEDSDDYDQQEWQDLQSDTVKKAQNLLRFEWKRVKRGEVTYQITRWALTALVIASAIAGVVHWLPSQLPPA